MLMPGHPAVAVGVGAEGDVDGLPVTRWVDSAQSPADQTWAADVAWRGVDADGVLGAELDAGGGGESDRGRDADAEDDEVGVTGRRR